MNNSLRVNYDLTINLGNQVNGKAAEFQQLLNRIISINSELNSYWEGTDNLKYTQSVAQQAEVMKQLQETIDEIGDFLVRTGNAYKEAMEANASAIK